MSRTRCVVREPVCYWCHGRPTKGVTSRVMLKLHSVCDACGEEEYQKCLRASGFKVADVKAAWERYNKKGEGMTFTLKRMSGKGIRMIARYLAVLKLGGRIHDTPDSFYDGLMERRDLNRRPAEELFTKVVDEFEERLREEEGYLSDNHVQEVASHVQRVLGDGMWIAAEVAADHHRNGVDVPVRRQVKSPSGAKAKGDVAALLKQLNSCTDPEMKRKIRRMLRKLGHRGGSR